MPFDDKSRNQLAKFVGRCRKLLCGDYNKPGGEIGRLLAHYGIQVTGEVAEVESLPHLDEPGRDRARLLRDLLSHKRANAPAARVWKKYDPAVYDLLQEQAFTVLNRLCAVRMAEARGLILPSLAQGLQSDGFQLYEIHSGHAGEQASAESRYRQFLFSLFDELSLDLPSLFERHSPHGLLFPDSNCLRQLLADLTAPELESFWSEDETIGWIYQYWNSQEERRAMRDASSAPRNSRELAVRNQFFTPRYVVEFLVDNTLGRIWYEMTRGKTSLKDKCRYMVRRPNEVFLNPRFLEVFENLSPWVEEVAGGHFAAARENATWDEISTVALLLDGYEASEQVYGKDIGEFTLPLFEELEREGKLGPHPLLDIWILLFICQRKILKEANHERSPAAATKVRRVWEAWCAAAASPAETEGLSQDELLRQPVIIPIRRSKDPREIRLLDPACGSMHFGLYAFDLYETIYREAKQMGLLAADVYCGDAPSLALASVGERKDLSVLNGNDIGEIDAATACVAILDRGDFGDGLNHEGPYLTRQGRNFRPKVIKEIPWKDFDFQKALREKWMTAEQAERLVRETSAFTHNRVEPLAKEEQDRLLEIQTPRLIIEHNIHGVDIDPRAVQIAGLSLWLRAQKSWQQGGVQAAERPRIQRSNIVCAEPMPGDEALLAEFTKTLDPPLLGELVKTVFEKMKLAGEAGTLLKIEEEIRSAIDEARTAWEKLESAPRELFSIEEMNRILPPGAQQELTGFDKSLLALRSLGEAGTSDFWNTAEPRIYQALEQYAATAEGGNYQRKLFAEDAARGFAFIDLCRKRYDAVVMNPPFGQPSPGAKRKMAKNFPHCKDIYPAFVEQGLLKLTPGGFLGAITSRTGFFQSKFTKWRINSFIELSNASVCADLGGGVLDAAMVETAAFCLTKSKLSRTIFFRLLEFNDKEAALREIISGKPEHNKKELFIFLVSPKDLNVIPGSPLAYWVSGRIRKLFNNLPKFETQQRTVRQGLATCDDYRFVRAKWEIPSNKYLIRWFTFSKGGAFSRFYTDLHLAVNWDEGGKEIKAGIVQRYPYLDGNADFVAKNTGYYFRSGYTYPLRTSSFCPQVLPKGSVISVRGSGIYGDTSGVYLSILSSKIFDFLIKLLLGREGHPQFDMGDVNVTPVPNLREKDEEQLASWALNCVNLKRCMDLIREETNVFYCPGESLNSATSLRERQEVLFAENTHFLNQIEIHQAEIDDLCFQLYGISDEDRNLVESHSSDTTSIQDEDLLNDGTAEIWDFSGVIVSYLLGTAFGRWDIRYATGERQPPELPDPFDPLPVCPPGMLQGEDGLPLSPEEGRRQRASGRYPLDIVWEGILVDDDTHRDDIVARVREALRVIWGERASAIEQEACDILKVKSLRDYFRNPGKFFADHLKRYSKSRRKAPIYWPISTESGSYTLWLYYHRLSDQTLYACVKILKEKLSEVESDRARLEKVDNRTAEQEDALKAARDLAGELTVLAASLQEIAAYWKPDLNDGVQITAAPLWRHFNHSPWQKILRDTWEKLKRGEYDWAHLAHSIWPERVVPQCAKDRSLAIAHGHDERLWHEGEVRKGKKNKPTLEWRPIPNADEVVEQILKELKQSR